MSHRRIAAVLVTAVTLFAFSALAGCDGTASAPVAPVATELDPQETAVPLEYLQTATVQILAQTELDSGPETIWFGSGTIVSPDGLILTNAHVAKPQLAELAAMQRDLSMLHMPEPDLLVVALVGAEDRPPEPKYLAELAAADGILDLAVLRITKTLDGRPVDRDSLNLPYAEMADSEEVRLGDSLHVLGFPGAGGETITLTTGSISGFVEQTMVGKRAWIKTDSSISAGASGGLGSDDKGRLIAIPTLSSLSPGGINLLRPVGLARPLIEAVKSGDDYKSPHAIAGSGDEALELVAWAERVDEDGCAVEPVDEYPTGAIGLAAVFEYSGMTSGQLVYADWTYADRALNSDVWFWDQGNRGPCFPVAFHDFGRALDDGKYGLDIRVSPDLSVVGHAETSVGSAAKTALESAEAAMRTVEVVGVVSDAESGRPVAEAVVLVLKPGVSAEDWADDPDEALDAIFTVGESDVDGQYRLLKPLERGVRYEVVADHPQYIRKAGVFEFDETVPEVNTVDIELSR